MAFCMWGKPYAIQAHSSSLGKRLPDQQGKPKPAWAIQRWNTFLFYHFFFSSNASCKFQAILNDTPLPLPHTHTSRSGTIKTAVCLAWLSTCKNPLYNWTRTEQRMGTEAGRGSCHSALLLCKEEKTQTVSDARGKGEEWKCQEWEEAVKWHQMPGRVSVCPCAACLARSIIRKDKAPQEECLSWVRSTEGPAVSDCQRRSQACQELSVYGLHWNLAAVSVKSRNSSARRCLAFKPSDDLGWLGSWGKGGRVQHLSKNWTQLAPLVQLRIQSWVWKWEAAKKLEDSEGKWKENVTASAS